MSRLASSTGISSAGLATFGCGADRKCNGPHKDDEEYFYHQFYAAVATGNPAMGAVVHEDIKRRTKKPQSRAIVQRVVSEFRDGCREEFFFHPMFFISHVTKPKPSEW